MTRKTHVSACSQRVSSIQFPVSSFEHKKTLTFQKSGNTIFFACERKTNWRKKIKTKRANLTEVNFLLALWTLRHLVAAVCTG